MSCFHLYLVVQYFVGQDQSFLRLRFSRGCSFGALSCSSQLRPLRPLIHLETAPCILSRWFMSFLGYGQFAWMAYSRCDRTKALYKDTEISFVRQVNGLFMKYNIPLALLAAPRTLAEEVNAEFKVMPRSLIYSHPCCCPL